MAQLPSKNLSTFSGIDASSKIKNNNSCNNTDDIIGTSVTLSTVSMDQIESIVQKLRNRGKRLPKSKAPLTLERPFSRAQSPLTKTAISISAETLTALNFSPPLSPSSRYQSISNANPPSIKTGREITPRTSEVYQHLVPAVADSYLRTGRESSPTQISSAYSTALPADSPLSPASRQQSISNVNFPSTKTGREVSPTPTLSEYSTAISRCSTPPSTHHQSISNVHLSSTKTSREITPRNSETALKTARSNSSIRTGRGVSPIPKLSGYQTALSTASPFSPSTQRQSISNVNIHSARTGYETSEHLLPTVDSQLIPRSPTVVPVNQNVQDGDDFPDILVHSFYVFSMSLFAWANHLSYQNPIL